MLACGNRKEEMLGQGLNGGWKMLWIGGKRTILKKLGGKRGVEWKWEEMARAHFLDPCSASERAESIRGGAGLTTGGWVVLDGIVGLG